jgi:hypothetical protein
MSENTKREELTKEQLERISGGFSPVDGVVQPPKPINPVDGFAPVDGFLPVDG